MRSSKRCAPRHSRKAARTGSSPNGDACRTCLGRLTAALRRSDMKVKATREGEIGDMLAIGIPATVNMPFVAVPAVDALYRFVRVTNLFNGRSTPAIVL